MPATRQHTTAGELRTHVSTYYATVRFLQEATDTGSLLEGMKLQQALINMKWGCSHAPFRVLVVFFSLVFVDLMGYYWGTDPPSSDHLHCTNTDCHCPQTPHTLGTAHNGTGEGPQGVLAHLPANLVPLEMIRRKHSKYRTPYTVQGLSHLDKLSLSKFYECSPAKMMHLHSVGVDKNACYKQRQFRKSNTGPLVALVSFQGSGNTWVRHILEQATGIYTGSIYCDSILKIVYSGEYIVSSNVLVVKTHHADTTSLSPDVQQAFGKMNYDKAIVLVRNPFNALLSEGNRRWTGLMQPMLDQHVGVANEHAFIG